MVIGIDASRAFVATKTGTENYSYQVIKHLLGLPESTQHQFILFIRPNAIIPPFVLDKIQNYAGVRPDSKVRIVEITRKYLWTQVGLAWETWRNELDVLWIPAHTLPILRRPGLATVVTIHGLEYRWLPEYRNLLQRWYLPLSTFYAAKSATRLIAVSAATKNDLLSEIKTDTNKVKVIWEGVGEIEPLDHYTIDNTMGKYGLRNKKYVLFVGTIQPRKNLVSLIQAWARVRADLPGYKLVIAGGVGWMADDVLTAPARLGVADSVVFTGRVPDLVLQTLYQGAIVYVQPSWTEGFGLPVLEAMRAGVAVVASDGGALPEVVGEAGIVIALKADFVNKLAITLKRLVTHKNERNILIARGYQRIKEFTWKKAAKETLLVLTGEGYNI